MNGESKQNGALTIRRDAQGVVIDISRDYFGMDGFGFWFRGAILIVFLTFVYFFGLLWLAAFFPGLKAVPYATLLKYVGIIPFLSLFFLLEFMGFYIFGDDGTSYFLSLAFYSPRVIVTPQTITVQKRWFLRRRTFTIPVNLLTAFETNPWFQFTTSKRTVIVCDGLKGADGKRVRQVISEITGRDVGASQAVHAIGASAPQHDG
jgi:hypothetical protein